MTNWKIAPQQLNLANQQIHIWRALLTLSEEKKLFYLTLLNEEEKAKAARYYFDIHRNRYIAGRGILRILLSRYLQIPAVDINFTQGSHGKPYLKNALNSKKLQFNVSHSDDLALYAFTTKHEIGVDLEKITDRCGEGISKRFFSAEEYAALMQLPESERKKTFFHIWTQKEAFIKAVGQGLSYPLNEFVVNVTGNAKLLEIKKQPDEASDWFMHDFFTHPEFCSAVTTKQMIDRIDYWDFTS